MSKEDVYSRAPCTCFTYNVIKKNWGGTAHLLWRLASYSRLLLALSRSVDFVLFWFLAVLFNTEECSASGTNASEGRKIYHKLTTQAKVSW